MRGLAKTWSMRTAISDMARVSRPGGHILIGNLNSWVTAAQIKGRGIVRNTQGHGTMTISNYLTEHWNWAEWRGIRIKNWHRPLAQYMQEALQTGLHMHCLLYTSPSPRDQRGFRMPSSA